MYLGLTVVSWYVSGFVVKPNQLVRERPFIVHNIEFTRRAFDLVRVEERAFPAEAGIAAVDLENNGDTIENIRLWDWRALQDTLRQIQGIRTYYDFPDIDIDRYVIGGRVRQMMVAARELNVEKLPESSRNFINEKLIYTHGYGVTMNTVNGFTAEGLPTLVLGDMPVRSTLPDVKVTRPEIYFGQLTNTDVYVKTGQKEFNYPQGESNAYNSYQGKGGIPVGSLGRRILLAASRGGGDLSKVPFSDDIRPESLPPDAPQHHGARADARAVPHVRSRPLFGHQRRGTALLADRRLHRVEHVSLCPPLPAGRRPAELPAQQREGDGGRLRRVGDLLRRGRRGPDHRRLPVAVPIAVRGRRADAGGTCGRTCATRNSCSRCRRRLTACTTCAIPTCSTTARTSGAWRAR